jgi:two-component system chemotaxis response regulator CheY
MRALVVDDSSTMRKILKIVLQKRGYEVLEAKNGIDALIVMEGNAIELMLVDWNMPEMNGFALLSQVRQDRRFDNVKIVMVTTETGMSEMANALAAGADEYIMKPFTSEVVFEKLQLIGL